jgi:NADPH2:quinone reductase
MAYGAARERVAVAAVSLVKLPKNLDADRAAALTVTYGTSYYALKDRAGLKPGETLAVLGAAGGIGLAAVELGKVLGARVIACASSDDKLAFARRHGADECINYAQENLRDGLKRLTGNHGVDVIYDPVGGAQAESALRAIAWEGRFLVVGFAAGDIPRMPLNLVLLKGCDIRGVYWGAWTEREPQAHLANMAELVAWCAAGKLSAHIHAAYPLERAVDALKAIADRKVMGKIILRP